MSRIRNWFRKQWHEINSEFMYRFRIHYDDHLHPDTVVYRISQDLHRKLNNHRVAPMELAIDALKYATEKKERTHNKKRTIYLLMLDMVDMCAAFELPNRELIRRMLKYLWDYSLHIDREILYLDEYRTVTVNWRWSPRENKQKYILGCVASWKVPNPGDGHPDSIPYLELPVKKGVEQGRTTALAEAMYMYQNTSLALMLLRCGVRPSCVYLWPVTLMIDLKALVDSTLVNTNCFEAQILQMFCRARRHFVVRALGSVENGAVRMSRLRHADGTEVDQEYGIELELNSMASSIPPETEDISCDDLLLLPARALFLLPDDRYKEPASLMHQARCTIREALYTADHLPSGIMALPLPPLLLDYVDLAYD